MVLERAVGARAPEVQVWIYAPPHAPTPDRLWAPAGVPHCFRLTGDLASPAGPTAMVARRDLLYLLYPGSSSSNTAGAAVQGTVIEERHLPSGSVRLRIAAPVAVAICAGPFDDDLAVLMADMTLHMWSLTCRAQAYLRDENVPPEWRAIAIHFLTPTALLALSSDGSLTLHQLTWEAQAATARAELAREVCALVGFGDTGFAAVTCGNTSESPPKLLVHAG
jgi:hypothetical protein